jgi:hypothetical protein
MNRDGLIIKEVTSKRIKTVGWNYFRGKPRRTPQLFLSLKDDANIEENKEMSGYQNISLTYRLTKE